MEVKRFSLASERSTPIGNWLPVNTTGLLRLSNIKLKADAEYDIVFWAQCSNCNAYTAWKEAGRPACCTQAQAEAVNRAGVLKPWYADEIFKGSLFSLDMQLPDYAVSLIKFTKIS